MSTKERLASRSNNPEIAATILHIHERRWTMQITKLKLETSNYVNGGFNFRCT